MTPRARLGLAALALPLVALLIGLGVWQVERLAWKRALIAQVERRLSAAPVAAPGPSVWPHIGVGDAYTRIVSEGVWGSGDTYVQAATELGGGYWVLTPFRTRQGFMLLVNRGFVPTDMRGRALAPTGSRVGGLLRTSEPRGGFLRANDPAADRWYSRDVAAIVARRGLGQVAPYFVDADRVTSPAWPRGGLTVLRFPNSHLQYALTWFAMAAALLGVSAWLVLRPSSD